MTPQDREQWTATSVSTRSVKTQFLHCKAYFSFPPKKRADGRRKTQASCGGLNRDGPQEGREPALVTVRKLRGHPVEAGPGTARRCLLGFLERPLHRW